MSEPQHVSEILPGVMREIRQRMDRYIIAHTDGCAEPNPGPAGCGYVLRGEDGKQLEAKGIYLGVTTNNVAEYMGVIHAAQAAIRHGASKLTIYTDSKLVVEQLNGRWKAKKSHVQALLRKATDVLAEIPSWTVTWLPREQNTEADILANFGATYHCDRDFTGREILDTPGDSRDNRRARRRSAEVMCHRRRVLAAARGFYKGGRAKRAGRKVMV